MTGILQLRLICHIRYQLTCAEKVYRVRSVPGLHTLVKHI